MQFIIIACDGKDKDALARRMSSRAAHLEMAHKNQEAGILLFAAATLNEQGNMCGSVMIMEFPSRAELDNYLKIEPYMNGLVWQKVEIKECKVGPNFLKPKAQSI